MRYQRISFVAALLLAAMVIYLPQRVDLKASREFTGTTNIIFLDSSPQDLDYFRTNSSPPPQLNTGIKLEVNHAEKIKRILETIQLCNKQPCLCGPHYYSAIFQKPGGQIQISFCDHCFDISGPTNDPAGEWKYYKLPRAFFTEFRELVDDHIQTEIKKMEKK